MPNTTPPTDKTTKPPNTRPTPEKAKPVHLLLKIKDNGALDPTIEDVEAFTGELKARRALDTRPDWIYLQLFPGQTYTQEKNS